METTRTALKYCIIPLVFTEIQNLVSFMGTMWLRGDTVYHNIATSADRAMPFIPQFVYIYLGFFVFWILNFILAAKIGKHFFYRVIAAFILSDAFCFLVYVFFPTTNAGLRPEIAGDSASMWLMTMVYTFSKPTNLFPSTHCFVTWLSFICVRGQKEIPLFYRVFSFIFALAVFAATQFTKQHVLIDIVSAVILAESMYILCGRTGFPKLVERFFSFINIKLGMEKPARDISPRA